MIKKVAIAIAAVVVLVALGVIWWNFRANRVEVESAAPGGTEAAPLIVSLATGLEVPWALDFLPDGSIILTERPGRIRLVDARQGLLAEPLLNVTGVEARGEGGLLGIAVHPDFSRNGFIYVYHAYQAGDKLANRVVRFIKQGQSLTVEKVIIDNIPAASIHDGGRIKFGPDGLLYVTAGDASNADAAQDPGYLGGKILRIKDDGTIPVDNPFPGSPVYTYGHRNPEGLAWDGQGRLWATEHGSQATDELNLILPGKNYGWPVIRGDEVKEGMVSPVIHSGQETWAPSGAAFWNNAIFFTGLRGQSLFEADISGQSVTLRRHLQGNFGRLREVVIGPDKLFYLLTSNRDGRGVPVAADDQLIRVNPGKFK